MKIQAILFLTGFMAMGLIGRGQAKELDDKPLLRALIFPAGGIEETYLLVLSRDGSYQVSLGVRNPEGDLALRSTKQTRAVKLSGKGLEKLRQVAAEVAKLPPVQSGSEWDDAWELKLEVGGKSHHFYKPELPELPKSLQALVQLLIESSPLPIDLRPFS